MRLDRTRIAILERSQPEVFDLTFIVLREFLWPILGCVAILAGPLALLNYWMIHWMAADLIEEAPIFRYLWTMGILVYVEAPLAGAIATLYLGKVTFFDSPTAKELLRDFVIFVPRLVWSQLVMRGVAFVIFLI